MPMNCKSVRMHSIMWYSVMVLATCASISQAGHFASRTIDIEDAYVDVPTLITKNGYTCETHKVTTDADYVLTVHRIPHGINDNSSSGRPVALIVHGILSSSADFVVTGPEYALSYILADAGYDVWMGNAQGNYYSRHNTKLDPDSSTSAAFWDFSWEEIGTQNIPAIVSYIRNKTSVDTLNYIGHSQGTTALLCLCSLHPDYCSVFDTIHLMAPVAYLTNAESGVFNAPAIFSDELWAAGALVGLSELFPRFSAFKYVNGKVKCKASYVLYAVCVILLENIESHNDDALITEMLPIITHHCPAGCALRQVVHYLQITSADEFQRFDYGSIKNYALYGSIHPPAYNLTAITNKLHLYYSDGDVLADPTDVQRLYGELSDAELVLVSDSNFTHVDYAWSSTAKTEVYDHIIEVMDVLK